MTGSRSAKSYNVLKKGYKNGSTNHVKAVGKKKAKPKTFTPGSVPGKGKAVKRKATKLEYNSTSALRHSRATFRQRLLGTRGTPMADGQSQLNKPKVSHFSGNSKSRDNYKFSGGFKKTRAQNKGSAPG
jgi:hypothetical protein